MTIWRYSLFLSPKFVLYWAAKTCKRLSLARYMKLSGIDMNIQLHPEYFSLLLLVIFFLDMLHTLWMHASSEGYCNYAVGIGNSHMRFYDVTSWSFRRSLYTLRWRLSAWTVFVSGRSRRMLKWVVRCRFQDCIIKTSIDYIHEALYAMEELAIPPSFPEWCWLWLILNSAVA